MYPHSYRVVGKCSIYCIPRRQRVKTINWEAIGAVGAVGAVGVVGEIMGAVVVVVTLFYLANQIRSNHRTNLMVAAGRLGETSDAWMGQLVQDAVLSDIYHRGLRDYEALEQGEKKRFEMLILQFLKVVEAAWAQQHLGVLNEDQWYGFEVSVRQVVGSDGGMLVREKLRGNFSENFNNMVDDVIACGKATTLNRS